VSDGVQRIAAERQRQVEREGWTPEHDDEHVAGEMAWAAVCYTAPYPVRHETSGRDPWPWEPKWDKRGEHNRIRQLEIAGALIAAEIDRLLRAEGRP
jgi:hypothetical protein